MATFQIHEDVENLNQNVNHGNLTKPLIIHPSGPEVNRKRPMQARSAFQCINNVTQDIKRIKIKECDQDSTKEMERDVSVQQNADDDEGGSDTSDEESDSTDSSESDSSSISSESTEENADTLDLECVQLNDKEEIETSAFDDDKESHSLQMFYNNLYKDDIWSYLMYRESVCEWPHSRYMEKQRHINAHSRTLLVDWLIAVQEEYKLDEETLHLAVSYIDKYLTKMRVAKAKFQLLGSVAMIIAGKIEEVDPPDVKEWLLLSGNIYKISQAHRLERSVMTWLNFELQPPTTVLFIRYLCTHYNLDKQTMYLAMYFSEFGLLEGGPHYLRYLPSILAASSIALARFTLNKKKPWPKKLEACSGYSLKHLSPVMQMQNKSFEDSPNKEHQSSRKKFAESRYLKVSLLKPRALSAILFPEE